MAVSTKEYDLCFDDWELKRIHRLRFIDRNRAKLAWLFGIAIFATTVITGSALAPFLSIIGLLLSIIFGAIGGNLLNSHLDKRIESEFLLKWDPIFMQRNPHIAVREEMIRLTDNIHFLSLPEENQRAIARQINQKHGLSDEP